MSAWIPIFTGLLAFAGVILGQIVASDLNTTAKRRDVRRARLDQLGESLTRDIDWMRAINFALTSKPIELPSLETAPFDIATSIFFLYFSSELTEEWNALADLRLRYVTAITDAFKTRKEMAAAGVGGQNPALPNETLQAVNAHSGPYGKAVRVTLLAASKLVDETLPDESQLKNLWRAISARVKGWFKRS